MSFEIRSLKTQDVDAVMSLYKRVVAAMRAEGFMQWNDSYPNRDDLLEDIAAGTAFGGFLDGTLAAVGTFDGNQPHEYEPIPFEFGRPYCVVHRLAVDPDTRRQGLSRRMMDFGEESARKAGCKAIRLDTAEQNAPARALYEGRGYLQRGTCHFSRLALTFVVMEKKL